MAYGILLLRVVLGTTMAGHGAQKLFGAFGGPGLQGATGFFASLRFRAPRMLALVAAATELGCGVLLAFGLVTPLAALGIATVMVAAIGAVHLPKGFWNTAGGFEFNLLIWTSAVALATIGPRRFSLDGLIGWDGHLSGLWWGVGVALASVCFGGASVVTRRAAEPAPAVGEAPTEVREAERRQAA